MNTPLRLSTTSRSLVGGTPILANALRSKGAILNVERGQIVSAQWDAPDNIYFIERGLTASKQILRDGRQQTLGISVPGDILDYEALTVGAVFSTTYALDETSLIRLSVTDFEALIYDDIAYQKVFLRFVAYQGVLAKEWLVRVGRLDATQKTAHLICEVFWRLQAAGHVQGDFCPFALKQSEWADILGLSLVQQNRSLKLLRSQGFIAWSTKGFRILDRQRLEKFALFDAAYLRAALPEQADADASGSAEDRSAAAHSSLGCETAPPPVAEVPPTCRGPAPSSGGLADAAASRRPMP